MRRNHVFAVWGLIALFGMVSCNSKGELVHREVKNVDEGYVMFEVPLEESRKDHRIFLNFDYRYIDTNRYVIEVRLAQPNDETTFQNLREIKEDIAQKQPGSSKFSRTRKQGRDEHRVFTFVPKQTGTYLIEAYQDMSILGAELAKAELEIRR